MEGADDDVEGDPRNQEPAGPVATVEHEDAGDDLQNACEMDVPVASKIITAHHTAQKRDGAEYNKEPTDDRDRAGAAWHSATILTLHSAPVKEGAAAKSEDSKTAAPKH